MPLAEATSLNGQTNVAKYCTSVRSIIARGYTLLLITENTIDGKDMKQLKGTGCYCVKYKEYWADGEEHYEDIEIVCQKLENGPVAFENPWR